MIAKKEIIRLEKIGLVYLLTNIRVIIIPKNMAYILRYDFNFILLSQLTELGITYHNHLKYIILKQEKNPIRFINKCKNFFI